MKRKEIIINIKPIIQKNDFKITKTYTKSKYVIEFYIAPKNDDWNINKLGKLKRELETNHFFNQYIIGIRNLENEIMLEISEKRR